MKKGLSELVFILDRSGSMKGLEGDTIDRYNSLLHKQRDDKGECVKSFRSASAPLKDNCIDALDEDYKKRSGGKRPGL